MSMVLLVGLSVEERAVGREMVAGRGREVVAAGGLVCCVARASRTGPSRPRILDMAGRTSPTE